MLREQNARLAPALAQKGYVFDTGGVVLRGPAEGLREDEEVKMTDLGIGVGETAR